MSKHQIDTPVFEHVARNVVPRLRRSLAEMGLKEGDVSPSLTITATVDVDGKPARVRLEVTLDPEEDE